MDDSRDVYRQLQQHLDRMPVGFPRTKTGVEIRLLKAIFSPEEARITAHLDYKHQTLDEILESTPGLVSSKIVLKLILDRIVSKGGLSRRKRDGEYQYAVLPPILWGLYEHQVKRLDPSFVGKFGEYLMGELGFELATSRLPKTRIIPIEESLTVTHRVTTYDTLRALIEQAGEHLAIQECICRKIADLHEKPCAMTERREVCMSLGDTADLYVEEGWARRIDQEEALEIARRNEEEGLVLMPGNEQKPGFMCACCRDCCGMLAMLRHFPKPAEVVASNYYAEVDATRCEACATCVGRCPIEAVSMNGHATVDLARCIGCGLCVPTCSENAMTLVRKEEETVPPETEDDLYETILSQKSTLGGRLRNSALKGLLRIASRFSN